MVEKNKPPEPEYGDFRLLTQESLNRLEQKVKTLEDKQKRLQNVSLSKASLSTLDELEEHQTIKGKNPDLEEGKPLPERLGAVPKHLFGKPLEEIDQGQYINRPFTVLAKRWGKKYIYRFSTTKVLFLFGPMNPLRRVMIYMVTHQLFDIVVMLTILANCVFLGLNAENKYAVYAEYVFTGIYTFEMLVKILARGFIIYKFTYLRDPWNWLDFTVIILAYVTIGVDLGNFSGLRTLRVLRALKTISIVPGLKSIINALLKSTKMLAEVMLLTVFVLSIFALFSLQIYMGVLRQKCVYNFDGMLAYSNYTHSEWHAIVENSSNWYYRNDEPIMCSNLSGIGGGWSPCPGNYTCLKDIDGNPNYGYTSFDNFAWAMLTSFQLITLDYWENVYDYIIRSQGPWHILFFLVIVLFGSYYLINLMLAVVSMSYTEEAARNEAEIKRNQRDNAAATNNLMKYNPERLKMLVNRQKIKMKMMKKKKQQQLVDDNAKTDEPKADTNLGTASVDKVSDGANKDLKDSKVAVAETLEYTDSDDDYTSSFRDAKTPSKGKSQMDSMDDSNNESKSSSGDKRVGLQVRMLTDEDTEKPVPCCPYKRCCSCCRVCCVCNRKAYRIWKRFQSRVYNIIMDPLVDVFITLCILVNTLFLAMDHYNMPETWEKSLDYGNKVFTGIFVLEATMKIIALDAAYFKSWWNVFDFFIVLVSVIELPLQQIKGFSVLRAFRLLRVFKLAQSWSTMRMLISIIGNTLSSIGYLTVILFIIIYIFAVIGMQLFGEVYIEENFDGEVPRWNFIDFYHSFMMVFRILCGEWIEPLYDCMRGCRSANNGLEGACVAIFILTLVVGNFMVLNLFLALLLNSFASDTLKKSSDDGPDRLTLGIQKLIRIITCKRCRKGKVGPANKKAKLRKKKEEDKKKLTDAEEKNATGSNKNSQISLINIDNGNFVSDEKASDIELTDLDASKDTQLSPSNGMLLSASPSNGGLKVNSSHNSIASSRNGSARSVQERPASGRTPFKTQRNAFVSFDSALKNSKTKELNDEDLEKGKSGDKKKQNGPPEKDGAVKIAEIILEDPVRPCFPARLNAFCAKKCCCSWASNIDNTKFGKRWHACRGYAYAIVEHKIFEGIVLFLIAASSISLIFEDIYLNERAAIYRELLSYADIFFAIAFTIEMLLKWVGFGFVKYFTSFWCWLDFLIVLVTHVSLISAALGLANFSAFRSLRTLRALRPLRAISRWQGMKIVVNALAHAIPSIFNVLLVCLVFWLIFSIMGVQFFGGRFYQCVDEDKERLDVSIVYDYNECVAKNYTWWNPDVNFDNVINGLLALFQVATFEGWMEVMRDSVDITGFDLQPHREDNLGAYMFYFIFIVCGSFFTLNLFIGVIIDNFNVLKKKYEGDNTLDMFLTSSQRNYYQTMKRLGQKKPTKQIKRPTNKVSSFFYDITTSNKFEISIVLLICLNMVAMAVEHYEQSQQFSDVLDAINIVFVAIFTLEAIMKIIGMRWHYFKRPWNVFDFIIVVLSLLGIILDDLLQSVIISPTLLRVVRVFRIGRVLRLVKAAKGIRKLLFALVISLPALLNIGALLFLVIFIYAILGMNYFGYVKQQGALDDMVNFTTFGNSLILLFRLATSAGWNDVLEPLMVQPPDCDPNYKGYENGNCGYPNFAVLYFVSFLLITFLIVINMYIAVILENFSQAHAQEEVGITEDDFDMFYIVWGRYDPHARQFIKYEQLSKFCDELDPPLRLAAPNRIKITGLNLSLYEGDRVHCLDVLSALTKRVLGDVEESEDFKMLQNEMTQRFADSFPGLVKNVSTETTLDRKKKETAVLKIQKAYRLFRLKREIGRVASTVRSRNSQSSLSNSSRRNSIFVNAGNLDASFGSSFGNTLRVQPEKYQRSMSLTPRLSSQSLAPPTPRKKSLPKIENTQTGSINVTSPVEHWKDIPPASVKVVDESNKSGKDSQTRPISAKSFTRK
uniref:Sodium channel protein n=1 Tax=Saccoglossus kowalevskii TaxID=10224 RepID=A0ABM0MFT3_SACKO|nr:PREDICTED: sodium channel protein 60E-like [Saccoglossus kowalevskii]